MRAGLSDPPTAYYWLAKSSGFYEYVPYMYVQEKIIAELVTPKRHVCWLREVPPAPFSLPHSQAAFTNSYAPIQVPSSFLRLFHGSFS